MQNEEIKALVNGESFTNAINGLLAMNADTEIVLQAHEKGKDIWEHYKTYPQNISCKKADTEKAESFLLAILASELKIREVRWPVKHKNKKVVYVQYSNNYRISVVFGVRNKKWVVTAIHLIEVHGLNFHDVLKIKI